MLLQMDIPDDDEEVQQHIHMRIIDTLFLLTLQHIELFPELIGW